VRAGSGCQGDLDCDGWSDTQELAFGTDRSLACSRTFGTNDESPDAVPSDFNDDRTSNGADVISFNRYLGKVNARWDLNMDGMVTGADILKLNPFLFKNC
jgi:hypothetical protein